MRIVEDQGFCTCCGRFADFKYGEENYSLIKKNLDNYKKYKDIFVFQCRTCGFVSTNLTAEEGVLYGDVKDSYEFKQLINYSYLNELDKELYDNHSQDVPANLYEAYSLVAMQTFIRSLNKSIELKLIMARKYKISKDELGGEEENDDEYEELDSLIKQSVLSNRKQIEHYFDYVENKNVFLKLIKIENLIGLNENATALKLYTDILRCNKLEPDLKKYFEQLLKINY